MLTLHEIPRRSDLVPKLYKLERADLESRQELDDYPKGPFVLIDRSLLAGEPMSVSGHVFSQNRSTERIGPMLYTRASERRTGNLARRRAAVINSLLQKPEEFKGSTPEVTQGLIRRNMDRILNFARTLRNKGKLHPGVEQILLSR